MRLPIRPPIPGFDRVRVLRTVEDAERLAADVTGRPARPWSSVRGSSASRLPRTWSRKSIAVTVVEAADQVLTPLDPELAILVAAELVSHGVIVETGVAVSEVTACGITLADGRAIPGELVVGIHRGSSRRPSGRDGRPRSERNGGIAVDEVNRTATRTSTPSATPSRRRTGWEVEAH